jgi:Monooxygenase af470-like
VFPGRHTAHIDGDFVVFIIGMRINRPWKPHKWLPVLMAMPPMVKELEASPESGFLGASQGFLSGGPALVQYWRSFEDLERYARDGQARHMPAWRKFNQRVRGSGDVGIWHETYRVHAGDYEAVYGNVPRIGLAAAGQHLPLVGSSATAARRIGARPDDTAPVEY